MGRKSIHKYRWPGPGDSHSPPQGMCCGSRFFSLLMAVVLLVTKSGKVASGHPKPRMHLTDGCWLLLRSVPKANEITPHTGRVGSRRASGAGPTISLKNQLDPRLGSCISFQA